MECRVLGFNKYIENHEDVGGIHSHVQVVVMKCDDNTKGRFTQRQRVVTMKI